MKFNYNDGGRSNYFSTNSVGDCVTRAIAIAAQLDYKEVYNRVKKLVGYTPRNGIRNEDIKKVIDSFGFKWTPTMTIGSGCKTHLADNEVPMKGRIICRCSHHLVAVVDGVLNDTYDSTRDGSRAVYGYWTI